MLVLLPTVVLLIGLTDANSTRRHSNENLNNIIDNAEKYNESFSREYFVEDVSHLAEGENKCKNVFFCKVHKILADHKNLTARHEEDVILGNLEVYIKQHIKNCPQLLKSVTPTGISKPIPDLVGYLEKCIRSKNFNN